MGGDVDRGEGRTAVHGFLGLPTSRTRQACV